MVNLVGRRDGGSEVDYTVNPQTGLPFVTGPTDFHRPVNHLLPAWDCIAGQMAVVGLLAAERHRRLSGEGQLVRLALKDVALAMLGHLGKIAEVMVNDADRPKDGNYLYGAFGRDFGTLDGKRLMVVALTLSQWVEPGPASPACDEELVALAKRLRLDFAKEGDRFRARREIARIFEPWFATKHARRGAPPVRHRRGHLGALPNRAGDRRARPGLLHRQPDVRPGRAAGDRDATSCPGCRSTSARCERAPVERAPMLGEHTDEILLDVLGMDERARSGGCTTGPIVAGPEESAFSHLVD